MRSAVAEHELLPEGLQLGDPSIETGKVIVLASPAATGSACPLCGRGSSRTHSLYRRTVSDLPRHGIRVELKVLARRFFFAAGLKKDLDAVRAGLLRER